MRRLLPLLLALAGAGWWWLRRRRTGPVAASEGEPPDGAVDAVGPAEDLVATFLRPVEGAVSSRYGWRTHPVTGERQFHNGTDYAVPVGTELRAPCAGAVTRVWQDDLNGRGLRFAGGGYVFGFAHLSDWATGEGNWHEAGALLGRTGSTGCSTGPHLHLTVRTSPSGELVDPETLPWEDLVS